MLTYEVLLHGKGLQLLDQTGTRKQGGVYVWRAVTACDRSAAIALAKRDLLQDPTFTDEVWNDSMQEIAWEVDDIREKPIEEEGRSTSPVFYIDGDPSE